MNDQKPEQHPVMLVCPYCKTSPRREGQTITALIYRCQCGATQRTKIKNTVKRSTAWSIPPNDAA